MKQTESSYPVGKRPCPKCRAKGKDRSGDNLVLYSNRTAYCFSCEYYVGNSGSGGMEFDEEVEKEVSTKEAITPEENDIIKETTTIVDFRGIRKDTAKFFGVRYEMNTETGEIARQLYPTTIGGKLVGYKSRDMPKDFSRPIGIVGKECDLAGQHRFRTGGRMVMIVGGEIDALSAYQMLKDNQTRRGKDEYESVAVVSSTVGEKSGWRQVQKQYNFFDSFEKIIIALDNDEAGREATEKYIEALPRGKVFVVNWRYKDPNKYLTDGKEAEFIQDFWKMRKATPAGVTAIDDLYNKIIERASTDKVAFPPFLEALNRMLAGGVPQGYLVNIVAGSGSGKTTVINEIISDMIFHCPYKVGVVSLEADAGEWGENLLSRYIGKKIALIPTKEEKLAFLNQEDIKAKAEELFKSPDGDSKLFLLDDRGDFESIQDKIEEMIISSGVKVIIIDPASDLFAGNTNEQVEEFMAWEKKIAKAYGVIIFNIMHARKTGSGEKSYSQGGMMTEESIQGSSSQYKSAGIIILMGRDKLAEDEVERNTLHIFLSKNRACGLTGKVCELYYDNATHKLWDKEEYFATHGPTEF